MTDLIANTNSFGIWALSIAAVAAAAASLRRPDWLTLAALLAALAIVIATGVHWRVHDRIKVILMDRGFYGDHLLVQLAITLIGTMIGAGLGWWILRQRRGAQRWASLTTLVLIGLFCVQALSVHAVDALLGRRLGPMMAIGWLWGGAALTIVLAAILAHREQPKARAKD